MSAFLDGGRVGFIAAAALAATAVVLLVLGLTVAASAFAGYAFGAIIIGFAYGIREAQRSRP